MSIRTKVLNKGKIVQEQLIRVLLKFDERITTLENGETGEVADISALKETVGDEDGGLVKDVTGLKTTVGDADTGLVHDVDDIGDYIAEIITANNLTDPRAEPPSQGEG